MDFHFATIWEAVADTVGDRPAVYCGEVVRSWADYDDRAARLASVYRAGGAGKDTKVGIYMRNCTEYLEAQYGAFKLRACPINVNYRYSADELVYLLDNSDSEVLVYQACYASRIEEIQGRLPRLKTCIQVDDGTEALLEGSLDFEAAIRDAQPMQRIPRDASDVYMLYTGGTTGMPKGVMYANGEFCAALLNMAAAARGLEPLESPERLPGFIDALGEDPSVALCACPLMHGTGMWLACFVHMSMGGALVLTPNPGLDPDLLWSLVERHRATDIVIVGDAFAKPMLAALDAAAQRGSPYDISSLRQVVSSGVMWSAETKRGLLRHHDMILADMMGSTEGGMGGSFASRDAPTQTARFVLNEGVKVFTEDDREVEPGSGDMGMVATSAMVPLGYYKDPAKSAATFREVDGARYSFPGDFATVEADGTIRLLGRGSVCINTAGEKVFPEEVEEAVKRHPDIADCLVVGVPDNRFGERVVAVASYSGEPAVDEAEIIEFTREHLAGYKLPGRIVFVDRVQRAPNGKADYKWARGAALAAP